MMKKFFAVIVPLLAVLLMLGGCGSEDVSDGGAAPVEDGTYSAKFTTDSAMFHVNEANDDRGVLTVEDGEMVIHVSLASKNIVSLFAGTAEDAQKDGAEALQPTTDEVTYDDGYTEEVYGFDIPVPAIDEEFDVALLGTKGKWYDHKVMVSDIQPDSEKGEAVPLEEAEDGEYTIEVSKEGGTGKTEVLSPTDIVIRDGSATVTVVWDSPYYDYMIVDGEKYDPLKTDDMETSAFEIPVKAFDEAVTVTANTTAMSESHEIEYQLTFDSSTLKAK